MARNPYQFDPNLMAGFSNLTRALIGSASDDAALARARARDAAASASNARAGLYGAQTTGQNLTNDYMTANNEAINAALNDSAMLNSLFGTFGLESGNVPTNPTGRPGPFIGNDPETSLAPGVSEDAMRGLVRSMFFGGVPGNPQQSAASAQTRANMANQQQAYDLLAQSGQSPDRQAAIRLGRTIGQYFDPGSAEALARIANPMILDPGQQGFAQGEDGFQEVGTNTYVPPQSVAPGNSLMDGSGNVLGTAPDGSPLILNNNQAAFDKDGNPIASNREEAAPIILSDGQEAYTSTGEKIAANEEDPNVITLSEGQTAFVPDPDSESGYKQISGPGREQTLILSPGQTGVIQRADGTRTTITAAEAPRILTAGNNETVQLVVPNAEGTGYDVLHEVQGPRINTRSGNGNGSGGGVGQGDTLDMTRYQDQWAEDYARYSDPDNPLPNHAIGGMNSITQDFITRAAQQNEALDVNRAYASIAIPIMSAGSYEVTTGSNFQVPRWFVDYYVRLPQDQFNREMSVPANAPAGTMSAFRRTFMEKMRYNENQVQRLLQEIQAMRSQ